MAIFIVYLVFMVTLVLVNGKPLDDYVYRYDPYYHYEEIGSYSGPGYTNYLLNMTSQKWKNENVSSHSIWWHYLTITVPDNIVYPGVGLLFIDGDSNNDKPPSGTDNFVALVTTMGVEAGLVSANLKMVPNSPITFPSDPSKRSRSEDAIIAWTFKMFADNTSDPEVLLQFPMTKASVRALDTMTKYMQAKKNMNIQQFAVTGASKRAWATWLTAAVDKRVFAMVPIEFDLLNSTTNLHHYYRSMGGWTFALRDYWDVNYTRILDSTTSQKLADIVDPLNYVDRYQNMPKLLFKTTGDEFFLLDNTDYYYKQLPGTTYLRLIPNAEHSLIGHSISTALSLQAFGQSIITKTPLPKMNWSKETTASGGKITLVTDRTPKTILTYHARTVQSERRDFRLLVGSSSNPRNPTPNPIFWYSEQVRDMGNNTYVAEFDNPPTGWFAFFIEVTFDGVRNSVLEFTTDAMVIPDTYPFEDCHGDECWGHLV